VTYSGRNDRTSVEFFRRDTNSSNYEAIAESIRNDGLKDIASYCDNNNLNSFCDFEQFRFDDLDFSDLNVNMISSISNEKSKYYNPLGENVEPLSHFDTHGFPTSVDAISDLIELDPDFNSESFFLDPVSSAVMHEHKPDDSFSDASMTDNEKEEVEEEVSVREEKINLVQRRSRKRHLSSEESESDEEWAPETPNAFRKKPTKRISFPRRSPSHRPTPQRRSPGTKLKITQWIVELLRNPEYNPKVITWVDEKNGVFFIKDTHMYAKLWGKVKHNQNMTYEKLSRAMRYSYKNDELRMVPEQRLTYQFGANMVNFRAEDPDDPNFQLYHKKCQKK